MKRVLAICIAVIIVVSLSLMALAAPGGFISSPSGNKAPELIGGKNESEDCEAKLLVTAYAERDTLPQEVVDKLEEAYEEVVNSADISKLNGKVTDIAKEKEIPVARLAVSDMFDISSFGCAGPDHKGHGHFDVTLKSESLEHFVCLLHYYNGEWEIIENARVEGEHLIFDVKEFSPFAIVVDAGEDYVKPPQTGDSSHILLYVIIMAVSLFALIVLLKKSKKKTN